MINKLLILVLVATVTLAAEPLESSEPEVVSDDQSASGSEPPRLAVPAPEEPPQIPGMDDKQTVFHQRHPLADGSYIGVYGYYDSGSVFHVMNYVTDVSGIRVVGDHTPFQAMLNSNKAAAAAMTATHSADQNLDYKREGIKTNSETLETGDGDNLLRDEHSIIRTHALPPPGSSNFHTLASGLHPSRYYQGFQYGSQQGFRDRPNYIQPPKRLALPYENPLYPLLYGDRHRFQSNVDEDDEINDTSGLSAADGVSEVTSGKPANLKPVRPEFANRVPLAQPQHGYAQQHSYGNNYVDRGDYPAAPPHGQYGGYYATPNIGGYYGNQQAYYGNRGNIHHHAPHAQRDQYHHYHQNGYGAQSSYSQPGYVYRYHYTYPNQHI